jgi:UDP-N-acetylmuramyl pentapeptide phosphotransferase/UDP-N-acetylglucosamine-1-phosphate transferase
MRISQKREVYAERNAEVRTPSAIIEVEERTLRWNAHRRAKSLQDARIRTAMSAPLLSLIVFACLFGSALIGMRLRMALPEHHLSDDSKHLLEVGLGIIGTMGGLVLGLLVASATSSYNTQRNEVMDVSGRIILLDRELAHYGPETKEARNALRTGVIAAINRLWPKNGSASPAKAPNLMIIYDRIEELSPKNDAQRTIKPLAISLIVGLGQTRWLLYEQAGNSISIPLLILLVFWFSVTFMGFGLFAPTNATVIAALALCAISVSGAVYLMLEMYTPFQGLLQIPSDALRDALNQLGH